MIHKLLRSLGQLVNNVQLKPLSVLGMVSSNAQLQAQCHRPYAATAGSASSASQEPRIEKTALVE